MGLVRECRRCHETKPISAAGLCEPCLNVFYPRRPARPADPLKFLREAHARGESDRAMAERIGWTRGRVQRLRKRLGLAATPRTTPFKRERLRIAALKLHTDAKKHGTPTHLSLRHRITAARLGWAGFMTAEARVLSELREKPLSVNELLTRTGYGYPDYIRRTLARLKRGGMIFTPGKRKENRKGYPCPLYDLTAKARKADGIRLDKDRPRAEFTARTHRVAPPSP